jgi:hypothetical protein
MNEKFNKQNPKISTNRKKESIQNLGDGKLQSMN